MQQFILVQVSFNHELCFNLPIEIGSSPLFQP